MSIFLHPNVGCIESLLDTAASLSSPNKKWRSAFTKIYCVRTLLSPPKKTTAKTTSRCPSYAVLSIYAGTSDNQLVQETNPDQFRKFVETNGIATALQTDNDGGICSSPSDEDVATEKNQ